MPHETGAGGADVGDAVLVVIQVLEHGFNTNRLDLLDDLVAPDLVDHATIPLPAPGAEGFKARLGMLRQAFPDAHVSMEQVMLSGTAEDLTIAWRWRFRGTHGGPFADIPPTQRQVDMTGVDIERVRDGRIVEHWSFWDRMTMLEQLGLAPPPPPG